MILTCPACAARYRLADDAIPAGGRIVRCAKCGHGWTEMPASEAAVAAAEQLVAEITPSPTPESMTPQPAAIEAIERLRHGVLKTIAALVLGLVLLVLGGAVWSPDIARYGGGEMPWLSPPLPAPSPLTIAVGVQISMVPSGNIMAVTGTIANPTKTAQPVPPIIADITDSGGHSVYNWTIPAPVATLPAGHSVAFDSAANAIPPASAGLTLHFLGTPLTK